MYIRSRSPRRTEAAERATQARRPRPGRRLAGARATPTATLAMVAALALPGCTLLERLPSPDSGSAATGAPATDAATAGKEKAQPEPGPARHGHAADAGAAPALEVAVLDPADYERGIRRRKEALAEGATEEPPSDAETGYYLDVQEAQLRQALNGSDIGLFRDRLEMRLRIPGTEAFETGSARLNAGVRARLASIAGVLKDYRLTLVAVHGHTDAAGDAAENQRLSEQRALAVARLLVASGLDPARIVTVGHGESQPLPHDTSPGSRWPDRRIEIQLELLGR